MTSRDRPRVGRPPPTPTSLDPCAARREAGRALIRHWLGHPAGLVGVGGDAAPRPPHRARAPSPLLSASAGTPGDRWPGTASAKCFSGLEQQALVHLGGYAAVLRGGWSPSQPGPDPDFRLAQSLCTPGNRPLEELLQIAQRHLAAQADSFYTLVFALQERGTLEAVEVRRLVLRARLRRCH
jgi:hypothetical protein